MAEKLTYSNHEKLANARNGEYLLGCDDDFIRHAAKVGARVEELTDEQCYEIADWIEGVMFDIICNACDELGYMNEGEA